MLVADRYLGRPEYHQVLVLAIQPFRPETAGPKGLRY